MFLHRFVNQCWIVVLPIMLILITTPAVALFGFPEFAWIVSTIGLLLWCFWVLGFLVYDSRIRWPELKPFERFTRLVTFGR